ncbi:MULTISPECIES: NfeD family protein [unclassified Moraxella]|uniref:NfeD family protein n=1 Tax=unclassified Moraxella TaxID=2685852 RepID=UPI002B40C6DD|nr:MULTISPECIES: NfeD family protein [unclassified Moraxella]
MIQAWHWLVFGVALVTLEMFLPSFFLIWFGVAALIVALVFWLIPMGWSIAVIIWLLLSIVLCVLWFRFIQPKIQTRTKAGLGGAGIIGEMGMIVEHTDSKGGKIRFNVPLLGASEWVCRTHDDVPILVGERAMIKRVVGNELFVERVV